MTNRNYGKNKRATSGSDICSVLYVLLLLAVFGATGKFLYKLSVSRKIAVLDKEIAQYYSRNESAKSNIANKNNEREAMKNACVVKYAKSLNMTQPLPAQYCRIEPAASSSGEIMTAGKQKRQIQQQRTAGYSSRDYAAAN